MWWIIGVMKSSAGDAGGITWNSEGTFGALRFYSTSLSFYGCGFSAHFWCGLCVGMPPHPDSLPMHISSPLLYSPCMRTFSWMSLKVLIHRLRCHNLDTTKTFAYGRSLTDEMIAWLGTQCGHAFSLSLKTDFFFPPNNNHGHSVMRCLHVISCDR